ncbi:MAG TPA: NAD(P)-binding protein [Ktedonobacterales bacterium]
MLIVGTGIAGLLAARALLEQRPRSSVLLVEQGLSLAGRRRQSASRLQGYGGAGLYLGGRLYLGPTTIPVLPPVTPPPSMTPQLSGEAYATRAAEVNALFTELGIEAPIRPAPEGALAAEVARAAEVGLEYLTSFPSRQPTLDERFSVLAGLETTLRDRGARFAFTTSATRIQYANSGFHVELEPSGSSSDEAVSDTRAAMVSARALVLAPGRYGAEWLVRTARALGAEVVSLPRAFGVRIEVNAAVYDPLTSVFPDPRLQRHLDGDAVIKTYATCPGGVVLPVERYGRIVASGVPRFGVQRGPNTTLAILLQPGVVGAAGTWRGGEEVAATLNEHMGNALLVQRLGDLRAHRATSAAGLAANRIAPSCESSLPGDFRNIFPGAYWEAFDDFLSRLNRLAPDVESADTLVYAPAEERFWHFPTDARVQTRVPGLFVAGDATGQSQGVIQAGVAGTLAGEGVAAYLGG